jgi:type I restriction-modification system DNA methylase subunit
MIGSSKRKIAPGQSAGEFYTPPEVAFLIANIVDPKEGAGRQLEN